MPWKVLLSSSWVKKTAPPSSMPMPSSAKIRRAVGAILPPSVQMPARKPRFWAGAISANRLVGITCRSTST